MHGRERLRNTASEQVRSGKTLRMTSMVSRSPSAEPNGPKYLPPSRTILRVTMMRGHGWLVILTLKYDLSSLSRML
jgi:hypothetical protein